MPLRCCMIWWPLQHRLHSLHLWKTTVLKDVTTWEFSNRCRSPDPQNVSKTAAGARHPPMMRSQVSCAEKRQTCASDPCWWSNIRIKFMLRQIRLSKPIKKTAGTTGCRDAPWKQHSSFFCTHVLFLILYNNYSTTCMIRIFCATRNFPQKYHVFPSFKKMVPFQPLDIFWPPGCLARKHVLRDPWMCWICTVWICFNVELYSRAH